MNINETIGMLRHTIEMMCDDRVPYYEKQLIQRSMAGDVYDLLKYLVHSKYIPESIANTFDAFGIKPNSISPLLFFGDGGYAIATALIQYMGLRSAMTRIINMHAIAPEMSGDIHCTCIDGVIGPGRFTCTDIDPSVECDSVIGKVWNYKSSAHRPRYFEDIHNKYMSPSDMHHYLEYDKACTPERTSRLLITAKTEDVCNI